MKIEKDFLILLVGRVSQAVLALIAIRVMTTLLDKENVGLTYLVYSLVSYFSLIFINPVGMYLNRQLHSWFQDSKLLSAFRFLNVYFLAISILSVPFILISRLYLQVGTGFLPWQICFLVFSNIYIGTWFQTLCPSLNMLGHRRAFVAINTITQFLSLALSIAGVFCFQKDAFMWLLGIPAGQTIGAILSWFYFRKTIHVSDPGKASQDRNSLFWNKSVFYFCLPIAVTTAFMWGQNQSYRLIVELKMGAETLGLLGVGLGVAASIASLIESLVNQYFYPPYYATISKEGPESRTRAWQYLCLNSLSVYIPTTLFVAFGAKYILRILVSSEFSGSMLIVVGGAFIEFFRMVTNLIYAVSQSEMKTRSTILPYGLGAGVVVGGLLMVIHFVQPTELVYIPAVLGIAGLLTSTLMYISMKRILPIRVDIPFLALCIGYSLPFAMMTFVQSYVNTFIGSIGICGLFGMYLLFVVWRLRLRIEALRKSL